MRSYGMVWFVIAVIATGCNTSTETTVDDETGVSQSHGTGRSTEPIEIDVEAIRPQVEAFCGDCHAMPQPSTFPRDAWHAEVQQGYDFYYASARTDLKPPRMHDVVAFYRALAPERFEHTTDVSLEDSPLIFTPQFVMAAEPQNAICVSHLKWMPAKNETPASLWVCDMGSGAVARVEFKGRKPIVHNVLNVQNAAHVTPTDFDRDGQTDLLVADLGSFNPEDHENGQVHWMREPLDLNSSPMSLVKNYARVADTQTADFDADGDVDILVAEFGWRKTGRIVLLENEGFESDQPQFTERVLDPRHGTIHVPIADLDADGDLDFVALISQEHEVIEAFLNRGNGTFEVQRVFDAQDPSYGSSGIELTDLDQDGDLDVLYTNGDTLDSFYLKPTHAIHWLENTGRFPFEDHVLTHMPGVYRAVSHDLDGDTDLDIVAVTNWPDDLIDRDRNPAADRIIWLKQTSAGEFHRHTISTNNQTGHYAVDIGDFDGDGRPDIAVGNAAVDPMTNPDWLTIWWNEG